MTKNNAPRHQRPSRLKEFIFGVPYYPEHWNQSERQTDILMLKECGINLVRMGEFAWNIMEPKPGHFDFTLFDETIAALGKEGIKTIFCTPTATPPRWLTVQHPDWMRVDEDGRRMEHGSRQHCCTTNKSFCSESVRITRAIAEHFKTNPDVVGWQTDNEFYCHFSKCYCQACVEAFQSWLEKKYVSIAKLNEAWGCVFWSQTYDGFDQVALPYISRPTHPNPSHELDYKRFLSDNVMEFQKHQVQVLRQVNPEWWITHNGVFDNIDYWKFTEDLDFLGVDVYPGFKIFEPQDSTWSAIVNEKCRAASGSYIVPEQQGGPGGQRPYLHQNPPPGQMRLWAYQSIAHGADGIMHFRWRTCRFGAEEYWYGILDHDNIPRRRYNEFKQEGQELQRIGNEILGTTLKVDVAILYELEQQNAHESLNLGLPGPDDQLKIAYKELWSRHLGVGLVQTTDLFEGLKLIILPSMPLMDAVLASKLEQFVDDGGILLVTARCAIRNRNNHVPSQQLPFLLNTLCGLTIEEFGKVPAGTMSFELNTCQISCGNSYETLKPTSASVAARWLGAVDQVQAAAGAPAICINQHGKGFVIYCGTYLTQENAAAILDLAIGSAKLKPMAKCALAVETMQRSSQYRDLVFVLNHYPTSQSVTELATGIDLISGKQVNGGLTLEPYGVAIIHAQRK